MENSAFKEGLVCPKGNECAPSKVPKGMELQCVDVRRKGDKFHVIGKEMASILQISPTQEKDWLFESNCMSASLETRLN